MTALGNIGGSITALITPFRGGEVDEKEFRRFVEWQITEGTNGLVALDDTGESATLSDIERMRVLDLCVDAAGGRVPVIAGAGANSTAKAIELSRHSKRAGADAVLSVAPYYNKPTPDALYRHFAAIADAVDIPILLYNIPGPSIVQISIETMARLAKQANIVGVKDATANLARASHERGALPKSFIRLSGDDASALGFMANGGSGCISITSNVVPRLCANFQALCKASDYTKALAIHDRLMPLHDALFCEASPAPVKYTASLLGICQDEVRLPILPLSSGGRETVRNAMQAAQLKPKARAMM